MILSSLALAFGLMLVVVLTVLLLCRRQSEASEHPLQMFEQKLQLLSQARSQGELAEADFENAAAELKKEYVEREQVGKISQKNHQGWLAGTLVLVAVLSAALYAWTGHYKELTQLHTAKTNLSSYGERALLGQGDPLSEEEVELFSLALRAKIANEGDDAIAWFVIGRIAMSNGRLDQAIEAFEKALKMTPTRLNLLVSYSQALLLAGGEENFAKASRSLIAVLKQEPQNSDALSMLAMLAEERGDFTQAQQAWALLLPQLDPADPRYAVVKEKVQKAPEENAGPVIELELEIPELLHQAYPNATLFVFVKASEGSKVPLAVKRLPMFKGAQTIRLSDRDAMQQGWALSQAKSVQVSAKVSRSGQALEEENGLSVSSAVIVLDKELTTLRLTLAP